MDRRLRVALRVQPKLGMQELSHRLGWLFSPSISLHTDIWADELALSCLTS